MLHASRPRWRLFCLQLCCVVLALLTRGAAQSPALTTVTDTVYRADGSYAAGTLLVSWPAFTAATGATVAAGNKNVTLGPNGSFTAQLAPNVGATPAGTIYTVTYQLTDGTVKTENWSIGTTSPETISQVRTLAGTGTPLTQAATQQYVNAQLATVVHLSGTETVTGAKQFIVPPILPAPSQSSQAVNKAYVDFAITNSGSGSFVHKSGDTMTGPLTLPADPSAPQQAADKHYVDLTAASKADLVGGRVPTGELGTGSANNGVCLHGDSTWGGCGTGSGSGLTPGMLAIKYATDFAWSQNPVNNLSTAGAQIVNLTQCPAGVTGTEPQYYVYISGTGTAEAALVTGGSCAGNGLAGTLQFTTTSAHPAGYVVGSASGGLQEALIAARFTPSNPVGTSQSGKVIVPPGELKAYARVSIRASNITVDFSGSIIECWMIDTCIFVGDAVNSNSYSDITLVNPRGRPTIAAGVAPFIEVNAQKTRLFNVATRLPLSGGTFGSIVQVDDDQAFLLDGLDTTLGQGLRCDSTVCAPAVYAPGPFNVFSAVGWLKNLNISLQCGGNGVDWESGNSLRISDSVIQGYAQYGVRGGTRRGGFGGLDIANLYEEAGTCTNPAGNIGQAGAIIQGNTVKISGGEGPSGVVPLFANTGTTDYRYYIVAHHATYGASNPLYAGRALTSGSGNITVTTADIAGATTFDLLRVTIAGLEQAPFGAGNFAVATGVVRSSACANGVCTFTDTQAALQSYTVAIPAYYPLLTFWPGNLILGAASDSNSVLSGARAWLQNAPSSIVAVAGTGEPSVIATNCDAMTQWTPIWLSCYTAMAPSIFYQQGALLLAAKPNQDANGTLNLKGRLSFPTLGSGPSHIITLSDSNFQKTIASQNNRPTNDPNDAFVGYDRGDGNPANIGISFGAPKSISNYIGNVGDGTNWLERLSSNLKEFKTNVQMDSALTVTGSVQASSFVSTGSGPWSLQGRFGTLNVAPSGQSLIGFGSNGKLQVSENGGALLEVAKLDTSGNIATAVALAQTPTQCTGSFATGIQANGNANCSTADQIQLAETTAPTGIPNYGIFWFDSTCHCPKVIDNSGQAVQLGLTNVFNQDSNGTNPSNTLEQVNGTSPQAFRVYGTWSDASNWERTGLSWDQGDSYFVLKNENAGTGSQRGIGFWIGSNIRWAIDTASALKPFTDNSYNVGSATLRPKTVYAATSFDMSTTGAQTFEICNDSTTGTSLNFLAKLNGANPSCAVKLATTDVSSAMGVVSGGLGTSGNAVIAYRGYASCSFDGPTTAGDYVQISSTNAGDCHDSGSAYPSSGQVLGRVLSTNAAAGSYTTLLGPEVLAASGAVSSAFGRIGAVVAASGDYTVSQVTGAAPLASPAFTGTPTAPTTSASDNSTKIATTAYVQAQGYAAGSGMTSGNYPKANGSAGLGDSGVNAGPYSIPWITVYRGGGSSAFSTSANLVKLWGVVLTWPVTTAQVTYNVSTGDTNTSGSCNYDIGIADTTGNIKLHLGSTANQTFGSSGAHTITWSGGGSTTLQPGKYYVAFTTSCPANAAVLSGDGSGASVTFQNAGTAGITAGGSLTSFTPPSDSWSWGATVPAIVVR
ncbi:MAG: putative autotransporter protein [Acidobacteriaceae bacterium]|nr:putative autotransporter protein [Acidobacteriaceae bacterium]